MLSASRFAYPAFIFMKPACSFRVVLLSALVAVVASAPPLWAGEDKAGPTPPDNSAAAPAASSFKLSGDFEVVQSYVGTTDVRRSGRDISLDEYNSEARLIFTPRIGSSFLRLGAEWNRYSFGYSGEGSPLPNTLQSVNFVVGLDTRVSDAILLRVEARPGLYGTFFQHIDGKEFNVPFLLGGTYFYNPELQIIAGLSVDIDRKFPVLPGAGVRWKFAPHWTFNGILPTPRLEYELSRSTTVYGGAEIKEDTFRVDSREQTTTLNRRLNRALVTFSEVRAGAGIVQKLAPFLTLTAEGGCQPYREFDYDRADVRYRANGVAPYGQILLHGDF